MGRIDLLFKRIWGGEVGCGRFRWVILIRVGYFFYIGWFWWGDCFCEGGFRGKFCWDCFGI